MVGSVPCLSDSVFARISIGDAEKNVMEATEPILAATKVKRRWLRLSLCGALAFVLISSIPCSWIIFTVQRTKKRSWAEANRQQEAVLAIRKMGWREEYDFQVGDSVDMHPPDTRPARTAWLQDLVGVDMFADVIGVDTCQMSPFENASVDLSCVQYLPQLQSLELTGDRRITDAALVHFKALTHLKQLVLTGTQVTDAGLENLKGLTELKLLLLVGTQVTDEGVRKLRQALPNCTISR
jgi:hypothetical protein